MQLPDIEVVSAKVHEAWMQSKTAQGVTTRKAEDGEELMVPYDQLSEKAKQLDRGSVQAVYDAITALTPAKVKDLNDPGQTFAHRAHDYTYGRDPYTGKPLE